MTKQCATCKQTKPIEEFYPRRKHPGTYRAECKDCGRVANDRWHKEHKPYRRSAQLKYNYGITLSDYETMLAAQNGACAICEKTVEANGKYLSVDHNHKIGMVRALLCDQCNCGLGNFNENPLLMLRAIKYLEHHNGA